MNHSVSSDRVLGACAAARLAAVALAALAHSAVHAAELTPVISEGDAAPGFEAGATIGLLNEVTLPTRLAPDGTVTFGAVVRRPNGSSVHAIFRHRGGQTELLFRAGEQAPGSGRRMFTGFPFFPDPPHSNGGVTTFIASVADSPSSIQSIGVWSDRSGSFDRLVLAGDSLDAIPPGEGLAEFGVLARGTATVLSGRFSRNGSLVNENNGVWRDRGNGFRAVAVKGMAAPGVPGARFDGDTPGRGTVSSLAARSDGMLLFQAWIDGGSVNDDTDEGLWLEDGSGLRLLAREGQRVFHPQLGRRGATFGPTSATVPTFGGDSENLPPAVNDAGQAIFGAVLRSKAGRSASVWTTRSGAPRLLTLGSLGLVGSGPASPAPGLGTGVSFAAFHGSAINDRGDIAFFASARRPGTLQFTPGVWWDAPGALSLVTAVGRPVAAIPGGTIAAIESLEDLTEGPEIVIVARIALPGAAGSARAVLRGTPGAAGPAVVVRTGESVLIDGTGFTISDLLPGRGVSDDGRVVALLEFDRRPRGLYLARIADR